VPYLREQIRRVRAKTSKPFGVNLILDEIEEGPIEACLEERVPLLVFFWGDPRPYVQPAHARGVKVAVQVGSVDEARAAARAGVDFVIAQGIEAGGHVRGTIGLAVLIPAVVDAIAPVPVIASGGVADGRGLVAVLALGGQGVSMGTRFIASDEAFVPRMYKERIISSGADDTLLLRGPLRRRLAERAASRVAESHRPRMGGRGAATEWTATWGRNDRRHAYARWHDG